MSQQMDISGGMTPIVFVLKFRHTTRRRDTLLFPSKKVDKSKWGMSLYHRIHDWTDSYL